jgi:hypothetical protein
LLSCSGWISTIIFSDYPFKENELINLLFQAETLFPQLTFRREKNFHVYIHHPLLVLEYKDNKEFGALLNFIDPMNPYPVPDFSTTVEFSCGYKNIVDAPLTGYVILGSTQVKEINNKILQMRLLLKSINVRISTTIEPVTQ